MNLTDLAQSRRLKEAGAHQVTEHHWCWVEAHQDYEIDNGDYTKEFFSAYLLSELIDLVIELDPQADFYFKRAEGWTVVIHDKHLRGAGDGSDLFEALISAYEKLIAEKGTP